MLVERVVAPGAVGLPVREGARLGRIEVYAGDWSPSSNLVAAGVRLRALGLLQARAVRRDDGREPVGAGVVIVTVTVNEALDCTLTVPVFQIGFRHRVDDGMDARRRQGSTWRARSSAWTSSWSRPG